MASPPDLGSPQQGVNARKLSTRENLCVRNLVLPGDLKQLSKTVQVKAVQRFSMAIIDRPGLTQCLFCLNASSVSHRFTKSTEGCACFSDTSNDLVIDVYSSG